MYKIIITGIFITMLSIGNTSSSFAQSTKQKSSKTVVCDTIIVHGVCNSCKDRIENAALIKGVKKLDWNKKTQELIVHYKPSKVSTDKIEQEVAKAGHDTKNHRADDKVYNSLPACCAYRSDEIDIH